MNYVFEIYITKDKIDKKSFKAFYQSIANYIGNFKILKFHITLHDNHIKYFIEADKDLSSLTSTNDFGILKPAESSEIKVPNKPQKQVAFHLVTGGNSLTLKEKMSVKK